MTASSHTCLHAVHGHETPLAASERGFCAPCMDVGRNASHQTTRTRAGGNVVWPSYLFIHYTTCYIKSRLQRDRGVGGKSKHVRPCTGPVSPARYPGRMDPVSAPSTPIGPHAPENVYEVGMGRADSVLALPTASSRMTRRARHQHECGPGASAATIFPDSTHRGRSGGETAARLSVHPDSAPDVPGRAVIGQGGGKGKSRVNNDGTTPLPPRRAEVALERFLLGIQHP